MTKPRFSVGAATAAGCGGFNHRASRLGREFSGLMAAREDVGALFLLACAAHGQNGGTRTHQVRPSLAGQGVALGRVLLCVLQRLRANRPLGLAGQALAAISLIAKHQSGQELATSQGSASGSIRRTQHAPGQELSTRTHQARPSLAGQGVALGWCCFACWGVCGIFRTKKTRHGAGWVNRKGGSGLLAARWRPL